MRIAIALLVAVAGCRSNPRAIVANGGLSDGGTGGGSGGPALYELNAVVISGVLHLRGAQMPSNADGRRGEIVFTDLDTGGEVRAPVSGLGPAAWTTSVLTGTWSVVFKSQLTNIPDVQLESSLEVGGTRELNFDLDPAVASGTLTVRGVRPDTQWFGRLEFHEKNVTVQG
jgi:hypothetical protein